MKKLKQSCPWMKEWERLLVGARGKISEEGTLLKTLCKCTKK